MENPLLIYVFLQNAYDNLEFMEKNNLKFIFTLYPGGGFILNDKTSDFKLERIINSPSLYKIITTQDLTYNYLIEKHKIKTELVENIFGVVTPKKMLDVKTNKKKYKTNDILKVAFVGHKYSKEGKDKGYDLFIDSAKKMIIDENINNIKFYVVGGFNEKDIDIKDIKNNIEFCGILKSSDLKKMFKEIDIIVSPTRPFVLSKGSFDGFPTGSSTEAMNSGIVLITTDELNLNNNRFINEQDLYLIKPDSNEITKILLDLYNNTEKLEVIGKNGSKKVKKIYSYNNQLLKRKKIIDNYFKGVKK